MSEQKIDIADRLEAADFSMCCDLSDEETWDLLGEAAKEIRKLRDELASLRKPPL